MNESNSPVEELVARHERTIEALRALKARLTDQVIPGVSGLTVAVAAGPAPPGPRTIVEATLTRALSYLTEVEFRLGMVIPGATLPIRLWLNAPEWGQIRSLTSSVAGDLALQNRDIPLNWSGAAADAYEAIVPSHSGAAARLATVAGDIQYAVNWAASAVAQFYTGLVAAVLGGVAAVLSALGAAAAVATGAIMAAVCLLMLAAGLLAVIGDLIADVTRAIGTARTFLADAHSETLDKTAFPGGHWPQPHTNQFADATVMDGDADWSAVR